MTVGVLPGIGSGAVADFDTSMLRDWNDELQTARGMPRESNPERVARDRAIFKVCLLEWPLDRVAH